MKFGEYLITKGKITQSQLDEALSGQQSRKPHELLGVLLVEMNALETHDLFEQLMSFTRERTPNPITLREWISQDEIDKLMTEGGQE